MAAPDRLIQALADGRLHSGSALAAALGVTRSAVWKQVHRLDELGLDVVVEPGRGYRLARPLELLDRDALLHALRAPARAACECLEVGTVLTSTSAVLAAQPAPEPGGWRGALAEFQTAGRGRRERRWLSPFGTGLCLSVSWSFASVPSDLPALSLAAGVAVRRALAADGAKGISLKWPNDVLVNGAKLAGILVDVDGDARGPMRVIVGVGVNLLASPSLVHAVVAAGGLAPGSMADALPGTVPVARNVLAARLLSELVATLRDFPVAGFRPLVDEWRRHDYLCGRAVSAVGLVRPLAGIARGIAPDGAMLIEGPQGVTKVLAGEISLGLRAAP